MIEEIKTFAERKEELIRIGKENGFITYRLNYNRVLKPTEHYQEYEIIKNQILTKEVKIGDIYDT